MLSKNNNKNILPCEDNFFFLYVKCILFVSINLVLYCRNNVVVLEENVDFARAIQYNNPEDFDEPLYFHHFS